MHAILRVNERHWLVFYICIILAWLLLFFMSFGSNNSVAVSSSYLVELWASMCQPIENFSQWHTSFFMWALMGVAMMAPTLLPALRTYDDLIKLGEGTLLGFWLLILGFITIWIIFAVVASLLQVLFVSNGILGIDGRFTNSVLSICFLLIAGVYQLTMMKQACLKRCRAPFNFFLQNWSTEARHSIILGLKLGVFCLGCCWALMCLAFVGGVMNIGFMGLATVIMTLEKMPNIGNLVSWPLTVALFFGAAVLGIRLI